QIANPNSTPAKMAEEVAETTARDRSKFEWCCGGRKSLVAPPEAESTSQKISLDVRGKEV
ncbi:hypothetical protein A2U01_0040165, partial [Trifolium medium]|nr:hypothetical protein [Trifolium medium]